MKLRLLFFTSFIFLLLSVPSAYCQEITVPNGQDLYQYDSVEEPVLSVRADAAKPLGVGPAAVGGSVLRLHLSLYGFSAPVDLYFGIYAPDISASIYLLHPDFQGLSPVEDGIVAWKSGVQGPVDQYLFGEIPLSLLPPGRYYFFLVAAYPSGTLNYYYTWVTWLDISSNPTQVVSCPPGGIRGVLYVHIKETEPAFHVTTAEIGMPFHVDCSAPVSSGVYPVVGEGGGSAPQTGWMGDQECPVTVEGMLYVDNLSGTLTLTGDGPGWFYFILDIKDPSTLTYSCIGLSYPGVSDLWWQSDLSLAARDGAQVDMGIFSYRLMLNQ